MTLRRQLLFVCSRYLFPIDSGGKIRTVNTLRCLKGGAFEISLASTSPADTHAPQTDKTRDIFDRFLGWPNAGRGARFQWSRARHLASRLPVAVATHDSAARRRTIRRNRADEMERYERKPLPQFTALIAVAERDKDYFQRHCGIDNVSMTPTGGDLDCFAFAEGAALAEGDSDCGAVVLTGSMNRTANADGVENFTVDSAWF